MNLALEVTKKPNADMSSLLKRMCSLKCRIKAELENNKIFVYDMAESDTDDILNAIRDAFNIISIDKTTDGDASAENNQSDIKDETLNPDWGGLKDKYVRGEMKKLVATIEEAMGSSDVDSVCICNYLRETLLEIKLSYDPIYLKPEIGNIVKCHMGCCYLKDTIGTGVFGIVCDIDASGLVYVVPVTNRILEPSPMNLQFLIGEDIHIRSIHFKRRGTVFLKVGGYISHFRITQIIGYATPQFLKKIFDALPSATDFSANYDNYEEKLAESLRSTDMYNCEIREDQGDEANSTTVDIHNDNGVSEVPTEKLPQSGTEEAKGENIRIPVERYLRMLFADALNSLDNSKPVEEQAYVFLSTIGFSQNEIIVREAFIVACTAKKITYDNIVLELREKAFPQHSEEKIKEELIDRFKKWLVNYPDLKENYPKISIMKLLKVFAEKMSGKK